ncbi:MAG: hypothetical protein QT05_C0009G0011 [archaeon GW2011_AR13]|nr:MAG: hypothetical protein QT05_C0009G0011 [archaeon GW2011_AR13]HIG94431.1 hypothetical protein [Nanoarchaeota archaeon]HIH62941.1 hypothetical protein [Nanoarchaeota archaeon]HIJ10362.1 hypothetical protein [Nanoarchaeota archaeon]
MVKEDKTIYYDDEKKIKALIEILQKYNFNELKKVQHYYDSILEKDTDEKILLRHFNEFKKIKLISFRERVNKKSNYDIYYELDDGTYIVYAIDIHNSPPILINAFPVKKNLKKFVKCIFKRYKRFML